MSGQNVHPHVPLNLFTPFQQQGESTNNISPIPIDFDSSSTPTATMPTLEEMQALAAAQAEQLSKANEMLQQQQQQMIDAQATFDAQAQQLRDSAEAMQRQQNTIDQLASAFQTLTATKAAIESIAMTVTPTLLCGLYCNVLLVFAIKEGHVDNRTIQIGFYAPFFKNGLKNGL